MGGKKVLNGGPAFKPKPTAPQYPITGLGNIEGENRSTDCLNTQPQCLAVEGK